MINIRRSSGNNTTLIKPQEDISQKKETIPLLIGKTSPKKESVPLFKVEERDKDEVVKGKMTEVKRQLFQEPAAAQAKEPLNLEGSKPKHLGESEKYYRTTNKYCSGTSTAYLKLMEAATKLVRKNPGQKQNYRSKVFDEHMEIDIGIGNKILKFLHTCLPRKYEFDIHPSMLKNPGMIWWNNMPESLYETFKIIGHINCTSSQLTQGIIRIVSKMIRHNLDTVYCQVNVSDHAMALHILRKGHIVEISTYDPARAIPIKTKLDLTIAKNSSDLFFDSKYTFPAYFENGTVIKTFNIQVLIPKEQESPVGFINENLIKEVEFDVSTPEGMKYQLYHLKHLFLTGAIEANADILRIGARSIDPEKYPEIAAAFDFNNKSENGGRTTRENLGAYCLNQVMVRDNCLEAVKVLVEEAKVPVDSLGVYLPGHLDNLTSSGANPTSPLIKAIRANNVIGDAFYNGNPEVVKYLLEQGARVDYPPYRAPDGVLPIIQTAYQVAMKSSGSREIVDLMNEYADKQGIARIPSKKFPEATVEISSKL